MAATIKHFFVLMMENRSFDHMLGFMKAPGYAIEGLDHADPPYNVDSAGNKIYVSDDARPTGDLVHDPHHHFPDVIQQLYGTLIPASGQSPEMSGFVMNYESTSDSAANGAKIMKCFKRESLPILTTLAHEYAVCDHWFSSIPGPTLPNRLYAHCGTSRGRLDMSPDDYKGFYTVYEELAKRGVRSTIFWSDWSGTLTFSGLMAHQNRFYADYANFAAICAGPEDDIPAYCFIEPRYNPADDSAGGVLPATDQHPDNDIRDGEVLIENVYNAIRQNDDLWHSSMLLIIYDEHGGTYDHVKPVALLSPDNISSLNPRFDFTMSGVRVPAVLVSPYVTQGKISRIIFDHTSIIATALKLFTDSWPSDALFSRAEAANTLDALLDLTMAPRDEWPNFAAPVSGAAVPRTDTASQTQAPLSDLQREAVEHAISLNKSLPDANQVPIPDLVREQASIAGAFVQAVGNSAIAAHEDLKS